MSENEIKFITENGEEVTGYIIEEVKYNDVSYIMVGDNDDEEADAEVFILKDVSDAESDEATYVWIEDDEEFEAVLGLFEEVLKDEADIVE